MLKQIPELHPKLLLYPPYNLTPDILAETLGVSTHTVDSWRYGKRTPQTAIKKLSYLVAEKLKT